LIFAASVLLPIWENYGRAAKLLTKTYLIRPKSSVLNMARAASHQRHGSSRPMENGAMLDIIMLAVGLGCFALLALYGIAGERL
jgi:hypothetical protein